MIPRSNNNYYYYYHYYYYNHLHINIHINNDDDIIQKHSIAKTGESEALTRMKELCLYVCVWRTLGPQKLDIVYERYFPFSLFFFSTYLPLVSSSVLFTFGHSI